jgi:hypothetical protein
VVDTDDEPKVTGSTRRYAGNRVLDDNRTRRLNVHASSRLEECIRRRLPLQTQTRDIASVDARVEQACNACLLQYCLAVDAGGHDGGTHALRTKRADEIDCSLEGLHAVPLQLFREVLIFAIAKPVNALHVGAVRVCPPWQIDSTRLQERRDAVVARLAIDVLSIVRVDVERDERLTASGRAALEECVEQLLPRCRV